LTKAEVISAFLFYWLFFLLRINYSSIRENPVKRNSTSEIGTVTTPGRAFWMFVVFVPIGLGIIFSLLMVMQYRQIKALVAPRPMAIENAVKSSLQDKLVLQSVLNFVIKSQTTPSSDSSQLKMGISANEDTLALNEQAMNHLLALSPALKTSHGFFRIELKDSLITLLNSVPVGELKGPMSILIKVFRTKGWLNSSMEAELIWEDNAPRIIVRKAIMNGVDAPTAVFNRDQRMEPRHMVADTTQYDEIMTQIKKVGISNGLVTIIRKS